MSPTTPLPTFTCAVPFAGCTEGLLTFQIMSPVLNSLSCLLLCVWLPAPTAQTSHTAPAPTSLEWVHQFSPQGLLCAAHTDPAPAAQPSVFMASCEPGDNTSPLGNCLKNGEKCQQFHFILNAKKKHWNNIRTTEKIRSQRNEKLLFFVWKPQTKAPAKHYLKL